MSFRQTILLCALSFVLAIAAYLIVLALGVWMSSDGRITQNLRRSVEEGLLTEDVDSRPSNFGQTQHRFDMFSECVGLGVNLGNNDRSVLYRILATPYISFEQGGPAGIISSHPCSDLVRAVTNQPKAELVYFRFWHGYQVYMRAVLSFTDLGRMRILNAILMYGSLLYLCLKLEAWFGWQALPIFLLPYAFYSDMLSAPLVTVHAIPMAWTYLSIALGMRQLEQSRRPSTGLFVLAFLSGSIYNFLSMLFTPQLAPALLAFMTIAAFLRWDGEGCKRLLALWQAGWVALVWFLGFILTWFAKWTLAAFYFGLDAVRNSVLVAASGVNYRSYVRPRVHQLFGATLLVAGPWLLLCISAAITVVTGIILFRKPPNGASRGAQLRDCALLQSPLLIVIAWTELMRYHSVEHSIFAQRAMILFIILPLLALLLVRRVQSHEACPPRGRDAESTSAMKVMRFT
jgi:hypothetical protein